MKILFLTLSIFLNPIFTLSQYNSPNFFHYEIGDSLTIVAKSGVNLRNSSSSKSEALGVIPFGEKVIALDIPIGKEEFDNRIGSWIKVNFKKKQGYIFSGFLTKILIPNFNEKKDCHHNFWFEQFANINSDTLICSGRKRYKGFDPDKGGLNSNWAFYSDENEIYHLYQYESHDLVFESNEINMNDILNILDFFISRMITCDEKYYSNIDNIPKIKFEKDNQGNIIKIYCDEIAFFAQRSLHKTIIRINLEG